VSPNLHLHTPAARCKPSDEVININGLQEPSYTNHLVIENSERSGFGTRASSELSLVHPPDEESADHPAIKQVERLFGLLRASLATVLQTVVMNVGVRGMRHRRPSFCA
jgi:hypothetical protein